MKCQTQTISTIQLLPLCYQLKRSYYSYWNYLNVLSPSISNDVSLTFSKQTLSIWVVHRTAPEMLDFQAFACCRRLLQRIHANMWWVQQHNSQAFGWFFNFHTHCQLLQKTMFVGSDANEEKVTATRQYHVVN